MGSGSKKGNWEGRFTVLVRGKSFLLEDLLGGICDTLASMCVSYFSFSRMCFALDRWATVVVGCGWCTFPTLITRWQVRRELVR